MRRKEQAEDYRYFPEPDLVPILLTDAYIEEIRAQLPELPLQRERRYVRSSSSTSHSLCLDLRQTPRRLLRRGPQRDQKCQVFEQLADRGVCGTL